MAVGLASVDHCCCVENCKLDCWNTHLGNMALSICFCPACHGCISWCRKYRIQEKFSQNDPTETLKVISSHFSPSSSVLLPSGPVSTHCFLVALCKPWVYGPSWWFFSVPCWAGCLPLYLAAFRALPSINVENSGHYRFSQERPPVPLNTDIMAT